MMSSMAKVKERWNLRKSDASVSRKNEREKR